MTGPTVKVGEEKEMSCIYGAEHLLRMIGMHQLPIIAVIRKLQQIWYAVSLPSMIGNSNMDPETVAVLRDYVHELMGCVPPVVTICATLSHLNAFYATHQLHGPGPRSCISTGVRDGKFTISTYISDVNLPVWTVDSCMMCPVSQPSVTFSPRAL